MVGTTRPGRGAGRHGITLAEGGSALGEGGLPRGPNESGWAAGTPGFTRSVSPVDIMRFHPSRTPGNGQDEWTVPRAEGAVKADPA